MARVTFSAVALVAGLIVILGNGYSDATTKWAIGMVGLVIGYWLR